MRYPSNQKAKPQSHDSSWHYGVSPTGNPLTGYVNMFQTPAERKYKYDLVKDAGYSADLARRLRCWRLSRVRMYLNARQNAQLLTD